MNWFCLSSCFSDFYLLSLCSEFWNFSSHHALGGNSMESESVHSPGSLITVHLAHLLQAAHLQPSYHLLCSISTLVLQSLPRSLVHPQWYLSSSVALYYVFSEFSSCFLPVLTLFSLCHQIHNSPVYLPALPSPRYAQLSLHLLNLPPIPLTTVPTINL